MTSKSKCVVILLGLCGCVPVLNAWLGAAVSLAVPTAPEGAAPPGSLESVKWLVTELAGKPFSLPARENQPNLLLDPARKRASGFSGCNSFFTTYTLEGASLKFGPIASTRRACPEPEGTAEREYLSALEKTHGWKITGGSLLLLDEGSVLARFTAAQAPHNESADLQSLTVHSTLLPSGSVTLSGGKFRKPAAPGSASEISVTLTDTWAFGTVAGRQIGAAVIVISAGGSGAFRELALLARTNQRWENIDTVSLGDRVKVQSVEIRDNSIVVAMKSHGPGDPACCPTLDVTRSFTVRKNRLTPPGTAGL